MAPLRLLLAHDLPGVILRGEDGISVNRVDDRPRGQVLVQSAVCVELADHWDLDWLLGVLSDAAEYLLVL